MTDIKIFSVPICNKETLCFCEWFRCPKVFNSISSLFDQATKTGLQYITVEHLLLMIMEDFEVREALKEMLFTYERLSSQTNKELSCI